MITRQRKLARLFVRYVSAFMSMHLVAYTRSLPTTKLDASGTIYETEFVAASNAVGYLLMKKFCIALGE